MAYYIGVDVGGTNIACGVVDDNCSIIARSKVKTNPRGKEGGLATYEEILGPRCLRGSGNIALAGAFDRDRLSGNL